VLVILRSPLVAPEPEIFPLSIHASGRYLVDAQGDPFLIHGDTPWSLPAQLTNAQITTYLEDTVEKGFSAIMLEAPVKEFTSQAPDYNNVDGVAPLTSMTDWGSALTAYWNRVDFIVDLAKAHGVVCVINPAYLGFSGTEEGWDTEVSAESNADLQTYGSRLATRYTQGNVILCVGGDQTPGAALRDKQLQIITGSDSVNSAIIKTGHAAPGEPAYTTWNGRMSPFLNFAYADVNDVYDVCLTEYGRAGPIPFIMGEAIYEQERASPISAAGLRRQSYQALLSGACGQFFGNSPIWHFESPNAPFSYTGTWESNLDSTGRQHQAFVAALFRAVKWHLLVPKTDTSLVSSSLSTGDTRICPALTSDATQALIWVPSSQTVTVVTDALTGIAGNVRIRLYNTTTGAYTVNQASVAKSSGQSVATGGERVIVVDAA